MTSVHLGRRFLESTRGRIVALLRRGARTVDELASAIGMTDNAVRSHLTTLERDGLVRQDGVRRGPGAGKPAVLYEVHPEAEPLFSRAYPPVLTALLDAVVDELPTARVEALMRDVGRRLADGAGSPPADGAALEERVRAAAALLTALGGEVDVVHEDGVPTIRGCGCPLSVAVARRPELCRAVETLVAEVTGAPARACCEHGDRPRCCFRVPPAA
ncbi:MAG TPA: helix-turn-helix domain-containing protein [Gemmatimonadaceae bacterium]|nr:helix-turn-helix domain-containing protein [Gemmatimonadaceae bacterium]